MLYEKLPNYHDMKVFACLVYADISKNKITKLDNCSRKCIFWDTKGDILFDLHSKQIFISRDTVFFELLFPYETIPITTSNKPMQHHLLPLPPNSSNNATHFDYISHPSSSQTPQTYHAITPNSSPNTIPPTPINN